MAKNIDNERETFDRINGRIQERTGKVGEQLKEAFTKAAEAAERKRKANLAREVLRCVLTAAGIVGLLVAENAGLISAVLTTPVCAIAFTCIGWHLCEAKRLWVRK